MTSTTTLASCAITVEKSKINIDVIVLFKIEFSLQVGREVLQSREQQIL